jgi:peptide/nickel transport system permease protein
VTTTSPIAAFAQRESLAAQVRRVPVGVILAGLFLVALLAAAAWPALLQPYDPFAIDAAGNLRAPSVEHLFGTDQSGRDIFSRVVEGTRQSLAVGIGAAAVGLGLGALLGVTAAVVGGRVDAVIARVIEVLFAFPSLLLALIFIAIAGPGVGTLVVAVGIGSAPGYARILRIQTLQVRSSGYVEANVALGRTPAHILGRTILPNVARPLLALATLGVGQAIVWASALSFLGLGAAPPAAEWGTMLSDGRNYVQLAWWIAVFPGLTITVSALATSVVGRFVQRRIEGKA